MTKFFVENFGCRATLADAGAIDQQLRSRGYDRVASSEAADLVVFNTCTVTAAADSQAREAIRKAHRANPASRIVVTGCYAQRAPEELAALPGVSYVVGNSHQTEIAQLIESAAERSGFVSLSHLEPEPLSLAHAPTKILTGDIFAQTSIPSGASSWNGMEQSRPIFKIQDGCNNRCSYCVIPFVRGRSLSLPPSEVIAGIWRLIDEGAREIVLSGINLGSYGRDLTPRIPLRDVVTRILNETAIERLRFSSIEPMDITVDFIEMISSSTRIAPHFHVPLQSGSDRILRAMYRWYRTDHYARHIETIHEHMPGAAIGADVIVGFPGEDKDDFRKTIEFISGLPLTYLHVFAFSPRPGTRAVDLHGQVPQHLIRERARTLRALSARKAAAFRATQAGRLHRALTLHRTGDNWTEALTGNYLNVRVAGVYSANEWVNVPATANLTDVAPAVSEA